jgi:hypothetical protein
VKPRGFRGCEETGRLEEWALQLGCRARESPVLYAVRGGGPDPYISWFDPSRAPGGTAAATARNEQVRPRLHSAVDVS